MQCIKNWAQLMDEINILGIIPARAGSKGIPGKNTRTLKDKPLIHWAANALMQTRLTDTRICSTDSTEIAECVKQTGIEIPWLRPAELATDRSSTTEVIVHALKQYQQQDIHFSHIALVQPTSPTVLAKDIDAAIQLAMDKNADTVISGFHSHHVHPSLMYSLNEEQQVTWLLPEQERTSRRQEFSSIFVRTGLVYVARSDLILEQGTIYGDSIFSLNIPEQRSITIDTEHDFQLAEFMMNKLMMDDIDYDQTS